MKLFSWFFSLVLLPISSFGQIDFSGIAEVGFTVGGKDSKFITNGISNRNPQFSVQNLHLFFGSSINSDWSISGKLMYNPEIFSNQATLQLVFASIDWSPANKTYGISVGRVLTPFGLFPKKQHGPDHISFLPPLMYGYFVNISSNVGYWPLAGTGTFYGQGDVGMSSLFYGGYQTGIKGFMSFYENLLLVELLISNSPISNGNLSKKNGSISGTGRLAVKPAIWTEMGMSFSYGSFMDAGENNSIIQEINKYKQLSIGSDIQFAYSYFDFAAEYVYNRWKTPKFGNGQFIRNLSGEIAQFEPENHSLYADLKIDIPYVPGLFIGGRFDRLWFPKVKNLTGTETWDIDVDRYTGTIGYLAQQGVMLKLSGFHQVESGHVEPKNDALNFSLIVSF